MPPASRWRDRTGVLGFQDSAPVDGALSEGPETGFAEQHSRIGFQATDIGFRNRDARPAPHDFFRRQPFQGKIVDFCPVDGFPDEAGIRGSHPEDARSRKQPLSCLFLQLHPQLLRAQGQGDVLPAFSVSVADDPGFSVMAAAGVGRIIGIDHQDADALF